LPIAPVPLTPALALGLPFFSDFVFDFSELRPLGLAMSPSRSAFGVRMLKSGRVGETLGLMLGMLGVLGPASAGAIPATQIPASAVVQRNSLSLAMLFSQRCVEPEAGARPAMA
jgi:hypothetical protein